MSEMIKNGASTVFWYMVLTPFRIVRNILMIVAFLSLGLLLIGGSALVAIAVGMTMMRLGSTDNVLWVLFCGLVSFSTFTGTMTALTQGGKVIRKTARGAAMKKAVKV
jgi:hypothetical protein